MDLGNIPEGGQAIHLWHIDIEQHNIGVMFLRQLDSLNSVRCDGHHFHIIYCG